MSEFDVIVLGATGYTGQRVCEYLARRALETGQRWAVAGRRMDTLSPLVERFGAFGAIAADCTQTTGAADLAARGRIIANLAGPYYGRAEPLVGACAAAGTHYLDLTGELIFVRGIIDRFDAIARASGARIAPVAGYEALPFDLMALALLEDYMARYGDSPARIDLLAGAVTPPPGVTGLGEMISGGTAETMRVMLENDFSGLSLDPTALNPADDLDRDAIRRAMPYDMTPRDDDLEPWSTPIFPGPFLHPAVVNRTFALLRREQVPVSTGILYRERMSSSAVTTGAMRAPAAYAMAATASAMGWLANTPLRMPRSLMKNMVDRFAPSPGAGPSLEHLDLWHWTLRGRASGAQGAVEITLDADGHPGYRTTANMIGEAALILADPDSAKPDRAGVLTPALALGTAVLDRFSAAGMRFSRPAVTA
ncbi:saccharopine dehydrogenase NADP-binding domain-containing protein [Iodidimonas sp. SYSU 1G8]|uniref:saccharopine dehydrogenase NADP-binding domain-containing protein n=1 Tax=Iodidimonas sp. SYSU 1G8 TaxID=3133967 RepID=UPI0031FEDD52